MYLNEGSREKAYIVYLKAITRGIILSVVLLLAAALVFYYTNLDEKYMSNVVWIITVLGICYSSIFGSHRIGSKGIIHGMVIGFIYMALLGLIAFLAEQGDLNVMSFLIMFIMALTVGALSGAIGVLLGKS